MGRPTRPCVCRATNPVNHKTLQKRACTQTDRIPWILLQNAVTLETWLWGCDPGQISVSFWSLSSSAHSIKALGVKTVNVLSTRIRGPFTPAYIMTFYQIDFIKYEYTGTLTGAFWAGARHRRPCLCYEGIHNTLSRAEATETARPNSWTVSQDWRLKLFMF